MGANVRIIITILIFILAGGIGIHLSGCSEYNQNKNKCQRLCKEKQENNVGARFMWQDIDRTFGKCTCVAQDGKTTKIFIKSAR